MVDHLARKISLFSMTLSLIGGMACGDQYDDDSADHFPGLSHDYSPLICLFIHRRAAGTRILPVIDAPVNTGRTNRVHQPRLGALRRGQPVPGRDRSIRVPAVQADGRNPCD